jgi:phospholipid transport system substrate-binding protein
LCIGLAGIGLLSEAVCAAPVSPSDVSSVIGPIQTLCDRLLDIMRAGHAAPFGQRFNMLAPAIDAAFDLETILQFSIGATWAGLPAEQKAALRDAFRRYTIASYVDSFDQFNGQRFVVLPDLRPVDNGEEVVQTHIISRDGDTHVLAYVMRNGSAGWRVVDVLEDGTISRVAVQRSDFRQLLLRGGAPALLESLQSKTANLSDGA